MNMRELSLKIGENPGLINDVLRRSGQPRRGTVLRIARAIGIPVQDLTDDERPMPDWSNLRPEPAAVIGERVSLSGLIDARSGLSTASIPIVDVDPDAGVFVPAVRGLSLTLGLDFIRIVLGARPEFLKLYLSPSSVAGSVQHGDQALIDSFVTSATSPGVYVLPDGNLAFLSDGSRVLARVVWILRRL
jgi:hypothetical protein